MKTKMKKIKKYIYIYIYIFFSVPDAGFPFRKSGTFHNP
jgi:hypothetical protein